MINNDHIDALIAREIEGDISTKEQAELQAWLEEDVAHEQYYTAMKQTWDLTADAFDDAPEPDLEMNWQRFSHTMDAPVPLKVVSSSKRNNWWKLAAAAMVIVAAAGLVFTMMNKGGTTIITADAGKKEVTLPDGSKVFLNRNSRISYKDGFATDHRLVKLEGEAFFEVTPDAGNPFIVTAGASETQVLGTSFVIKAYEHKTVQLNVVTGKVSFSGKKSPKDALVLTAGHTAILQLNKEPEQIQNSDPNFMAWKENRLVFDNVPLFQTLNTLEEYFDVRFVVMDSSLLNIKYSLTGNDNPSLPRVLEVLSETMHITIKEESKGVYKVSR